MRTRATLVIGFMPMLIAIFSFTQANVPDDDPPDLQQDSSHSRHAVRSMFLYPDLKPSAARLMQMKTDLSAFKVDLVEGKTGRLDTSRFALNVLHPRDSGAVLSILETIDRIPKENKEFFTGFQNDDGTGRTITLIVSKDSLVDAAHLKLVGDFNSKIDERKALRETLRKRVYLIGLLITVIAGLSALITTVYGSKGTKTFVITVALLTFGTAILGYVSQDRADGLAAVNKNIDSVKDLMSDYLQHRAEHAAVPTRMLTYIEEISLELRMMD
ncbi:MAG: hypothetical protein IPL64_04200 [Flavobacteriales bacterium]|nr:hypothetical protein [Flavobacteriales bacterium]